LYPGRQSSTVVHIDGVQRERRRILGYEVKNNKEREKYIFASVFTLPDRLCGLVVRVPGYTTEMYCDSCKVRIEFIHEYVMYKKIDRLCGLVVRVPGYGSRVPGSIPCATRFSEK
jgi:hypothetical protein